MPLGHQSSYLGGTGVIAGRYSARVGGGDVKLTRYFHLAPKFILFYLFIY